MTDIEKSPSLEEGDEGKSVTATRTTPSYPSPRIARCIMRFLLTVLYLLFLYMEPTSDLSISTIATSDDGMRFAVLRKSACAVRDVGSVLVSLILYLTLGSCAGVTCTDLLEGQGGSMEESGLTYC
jgi:hypothetical protein